MRHTVTPSWQDQACVILADGPSVGGAMSKKLRAPGRHFIAINDIWRLAPWADICYFSETYWWHHQQAQNPRSEDGSVSFHDMIYRANWITTTNFAEHPQVKCLWSTGQSGLERNPAALRNGGTPGFAAINLAYHFGAKKIVLLGYDMTKDEALLSAQLALYESLVEPLEAEHVDVINATPDSTLRCWPCLPFEEAIEKIWTTSV